MINMKIFVKRIFLNIFYIQKFEKIYLKLILNIFHVEQINFWIFKIDLILNILNIQLQFVNTPKFKSIH